MATPTTVTPVGSVAEPVTEFAPSGSRSARGRWIDHWDPEDPGFWASVGKSDRLPQPRVLDRRRAHRLLDLAAVEHRRRQDARQRRRHRRGVRLGADHGSGPVADGGRRAGSARSCAFRTPSPSRSSAVATGPSSRRCCSSSRCLGLAWVVDHPESAVRRARCSSRRTAGFGGGNFASSMANITFFYPEQGEGLGARPQRRGRQHRGRRRAEGRPGRRHRPRWSRAVANAGLVYIPLAVAAAVLAYLFMDNLSEAKADLSPRPASTHHSDTWIMAFLYIGTFGSFIGYSAAFPTLLKAVFDRPDIALTWGFLGAPRRARLASARREARRPDRRARSSPSSPSC